MKGRAFSCIVLAILITASLTFIITDNSKAQDIESDIIHIGEGNFYISGPYDAWTYSEIWVNITVTSGGNIDVYVMTYTQVDNAYPYSTYYYGDYSSSDDATEPRAISHKTESVEDVAVANIHYEFEEGGGDYYYDYSDDEIFIIIDNRNCNITSNDADTEGVVSLEMALEYEYSSSWTDDPFTDIIGGLILVGGIGLLILVSIVVLAIYGERKKKDKRQPQQLQPMSFQPVYQTTAYQRQGYPQPAQPPQPTQPQTPVQDEKPQTQAAGTPVEPDETLPSEL